MAKFDLATFKQAGKDKMKAAAVNGGQIGLLTVGVIGSQKFLDFKTWFKKKLDDGSMKPGDFIFKHEGLIKVGGVLGILAFWKKPPAWIKWLLFGIAIQGAIKEVRSFAAKDDGTNYVPQIGNNNASDQQINDAANKIINAANEFTTQVAGMDSQAVVQDTSTQVAGMGMGAGWNTSNSPYITN